VLKFLTCRLTHLSVCVTVWVSVSVSVCPESVLWQIGWLDLDAVWDGEWGRSSYKVLWWVYVFVCGSTTWRQTTTVFVLSSWEWVTGDEVCCLRLSCFISHPADDRRPSQPEIDNISSKQCGRFIAVLFWQTMPYFRGVFLVKVVIVVVVVYYARLAKHTWIYNDTRWLYKLCV